MKKIITIATVALISTLSAAPMMQGAGMQGMGMQNRAMQKVRAIDHANPMPNLMRIAIGNAELLNIDDKQLGTLLKWSQKNKPLMRQMVQDLSMQERTLRQNALTSGKDLKKLANSITETRAKIMAMKIDCREYLKNTLTPQQFTNLVNIYTTTR